MFGSHAVAEMGDSSLFVGLCVCVTERRDVHILKGAGVVLFTLCQVAVIQQSKQDTEAPAGYET